MNHVFDVTFVTCLLVTQLKVMSGFINIVFLSQSKDIAPDVDLYCYVYFCIK